MSVAHVPVWTLAAGVVRRVERAARQSDTHDVVGPAALVNGLAALGVAMRGGWLLGSLGVGAVIGPGGRKRPAARDLPAAPRDLGRSLDLWHVKGLVGALADGKTKLRGLDLNDEKYVDDLAEETESLHQTVIELKEELKSLIELHINLKSSR